MNKSIYAQRRARVDTQVSREGFAIVISSALSVDMHDCDHSVQPRQVGEARDRRDPLTNRLIKERPSRVLQAGMVLGIEPGADVQPAEGAPEASQNFGIRIERDAIVTITGCELLPQHEPANPDELEALLRA